MKSIDAALSLSFQGGLRWNLIEAQRLGENFFSTYRAAAPYPHIVIDDFLPEGLARCLSDQFPARRAASDVEFDLGYAGSHKRMISPETCAPEVRAAVAFFTSATFLRFLEALTGIDGLIADPHFEGGGFHEIRTGGAVGVHADFRIHPHLHLLRRVNVIVYLNEDWDDSWNGHLELWDAGMLRCVRRITPHFNRCVIFNTAGDTYHGHPEPLESPEGVTRRSLAVYYYSASQAIYLDVPDTGSLYAPRPGDPPQARRQAAALRRQELLRQWLPPVLWRGSRRLVRAVARARDRLAGTGGQRS